MTKENKQVENIRAYVYEEFLFMKDKYERGVGIKIEDRTWFCVMMNTFKQAGMSRIEAETICSRINTDPVTIVEEMIKEHTDETKSGIGYTRYDKNTLKEVLHRLKQDKEGK
jgi:hypothetical protein